MYNTHRLTDGQSVEQTDRTIDRDLDRDKVLELTEETEDHTSRPNPVIFTSSLELGYRP